VFEHQYFTVYYWDVVGMREIGDPTICYYKDDKRYEGEPVIWIEW